MSEYDHVAMLLRYSNGKLVIFESTGQTVSERYILLFEIIPNEYIIGCCSTRLGCVCEKQLAHSVSKAILS